MNDPTLSVCVRLSRKAYFPGAVVSGIVTLEPLLASEMGEYLSFLSVQLHGHLGIASSMACFPEEIQSKRKMVNAVAYGNVNKFINDTTDCIYQTNPMIIAADITIHTIKAYFFQVTLPNDIPPSLRTSCAHYFHLLSLCFSDRQGKPRFLSIPITVQIPAAYRGTDIYSFSVIPRPLLTPSYSEDITDEYISKFSIVVAEEIPESITNASQSSSLLEFQRLADLDLQASMRNDGWSQNRLLTSYTEFLTANPKEVNEHREWEGARSRAQFGIFGITHHSQVICNLQVQTSPLIVGDCFQMIADFSEVEIPCEQMIISLVYEEYSPYLKGRIVKSTTVNSIVVNTRSIKKYPYSFSIPPMYPPTLQTAQVSIAWKVRFSFSFSPDWSRRDTPETSACYVFNPDQYHDQKLTKVDWTYDLDVRGCVNERFGDVLKVRSEFDGKEETLRIYNCLLW